MELKKLTEEEINDIHSRGYVTPTEILNEWERLNLCAPNKINTERCQQFNSCHECLVDYASKQDKWFSVLKLLGNPNHIFESNGKEAHSLSQERIDEIHRNGNNTAKEQVDEWESLGLCAPNNAAGQEVDRCKDFKNCHECLVDFADQQDEWVSVYRIASLLGEQPMYNPGNVLKIKVKKKD